MPAAASEAAGWSKIRLDAPGRRAGPDRRIQDHRHAPQGEQHLRHVVHGGHQRADAPRIGGARQPQQRDDAEVHRQVDQRTVYGVHPLGGDVRLREIAGGGPESARLLPFHAEGLDHAHRAQEFAADGAEPVERALHGEEPREAGGHVAPDEHARHRKQHDDDRQLTGNLHHDQHDRADAGDRRLEHDAHQALGEVLDLHHIVGDARDDGAGLQAIHLIAAQGHDRAVGVGTDVAADELGGAGGEDVARDRTQRANGRDGEHHRPPHEHPVQVAVRHAVIHHHRHQRGLQQVGHGLDAQERDRGQGHGPMPAHIPKDESHRSPRARESPSTQYRPASAPGRVSKA